MDAEQQPKQKRPYKRKMTEQRKSQNRAAQKIYSTCFVIRVRKVSGDAHTVQERGKKSVCNFSNDKLQNCSRIRRVMQAMVQRTTRSYYYL